MAPLKLRPTPTPAPHWWHSLSEILGFSRRQAREFWQALSASQDARLRALRFRCEEHERYLKSHRLDLLTDGRRLNDFLSQVWSPHQMCTCLEVLFRENRLTRQTCTALQEKFLVRTGPDGRWTFPPEEG